ncbi:MAG: metal-dependent transcriptional regulator [Eubacteriaceae bacterium]|nr:metal-dependent transcriptional regulator [Eubacteriaceae bacterium]
MIEHSKKDIDKLTESIEDYLEMIYLHHRDTNEGVRLTDIAEGMGVKKASATDAVRRLKEKGFVDHERYGRIFLTPEGERVAIAVYDKHVTITRYIHEILHVDAATAEEDACCIEHVISDETFEQMKKALEEKSKA